MIPPQVHVRCRLPVQADSVCSVPRRVPRKNRNVRVEDPLWDDCLEIADKRYEVLSEKIRGWLAQYREENRHLLENDAPD